MLIDRDLVIRLESSAAGLAADVGRSFRRLDPDDVAVIHELGDGVLVAEGPGRYVNRAIGVSLRDLADHELDEVESFFAGAGLPSSIEVCSWAPPPLLERLAGRGYTLNWFRNVYVAPVADHRSTAVELSVRRVHDESDVLAWLEIRAAGFGLSSTETRAADSAHARASRAVPGTVDLLVDIDGVAAACASVQPRDGIAWVGGATTAPEYRNCGVQGALLAHRLELVQSWACDLVAATALPAGASARNLLRAGFSLAYAQAVMTRMST